MAEFNTREAQERWNNLGSGDKATIDKIMRGQGTMQDFRKIQSLIGRYDRLASKIFNQAVEALGASAQARVDAVAAKREARGKPLDEQQLSQLLDTANKKAWDDAGPELVVIIEESMASQLAQQDERLSTMFGEKLSEAFTDERAKDAQQDILGDLGEAKEEEKRWNQRIEDLKDWMADEFYRLNNFEDRVGAAAGNAVKDVLDAWGIGDAAGMSEGVGATSTVSGTAGSSAQSPILGKNYTSETLGKISESLEDLAEGTSGDDEREQKRANIWWRTLKAMGGFGAKVAGVAKSIFGSSLFGKMAKLVGGLLVTELLGGQVLRKIGEFLSTDKLQEWGGKFLDFISDNAKKLTDWIVGQFKSASESRDEKAGVKDSDPEALKDMKRDLLKVEAIRNNPEILGYRSSTPEDRERDITMLDAEIAEKKKAIAEMEAATKPATGTVGSAPSQTMPMSGAAGGGGSIVSPGSSAPAPSVDSTVSSAGPLVSKGAGQSAIPRLGSDTTDTRFTGDPATSMYTITESPTFNVGDRITSKPQTAAPTTQQTNAPLYNGSNTAVNLSNFRRTPGDDMLTLMNMGMYTS